MLQIWSNFDIIQLKLQFKRAFTFICHLPFSVWTRDELTSWLNDKHFKLLCLCWDVWTDQMSENWPVLLKVSFS